MLLVDALANTILGEFLQQTLLQNNPTGFLAAVRLKHVQPFNWTKIKLKMAQTLALIEKEQTPLWILQSHYYPVCANCLMSQQEEVLRT